jgi:hypothetical protein
MHPGDQLDVDLDRGEPEEMVVPGLRDAGHLVWGRSSLGAPAGDLWWLMAQGLS